MHKSDLQLLYDYHYWANARILKAAGALSQEQFSAPAQHSWGGLRGTLVHALSAESIWRKRCQEQGSATRALSEEDFPTFAALLTRWQTEETAMRGYIESLDDDIINQPLRYAMTDGTVHETILWQILMQVVNHGTQHRAECAAMLTELGHSPGNLDLLVYLREQKK